MFHYKLDLQDHLENVVPFRQTLSGRPYDDLPNWIKDISDLDWDLMIFTLLLQRLVSTFFLDEEHKKLVDPHLNIVYKASV